MKVLFLGTPDFAVPSLKALLDSKHEVVGVVCQPDRALKHGKTEVGAVKTEATNHGLKVFQPVKIREHVDELKAFNADIAVTAAYGQILTDGVLNAFPYGVINVHASLLPKYRGASPIQSAIASGEIVTGVTIMKTERGLDTGDILTAVSTPIGEYETAGELTVRLAEMGAKLLVETLDNYADITPEKQNGELATNCRVISKEEQFIDFSLDCRAVVNRIRSLSPLPCAKTFINGEQFKIYNALVSDLFVKAQAGEIVFCKDKLIIACGNGAIEVKTIQAPSKRAMDISDFLRGRKFDVGVICAKQP